MKKNLNFAQTALLNEIKVYNDEMRWDSYYFEGYQHDAEPHTLEEAGEAYLDDKDFMLEAVKIGSKSLEFASIKLKKNKTIVKAAIKQSAYWGYKYTGEILKKDKDLFLWCISNKFEVSISDIDKTLWQDKNLIYKYLKTFNICIFSSGVYWYDDELEKDKKLLEMLPVYFKDKTFIEKLIKIKDKSNNLAYKKAYKLLYAKNPKRDVWPKK